jgi:hypothetical protein
LKKKVGVTAGKYAKAFSHFNVTEVLRIHTDDYVEEFDGSVFKKAGIGHRSLTVYNTMEPEYVIRDYNLGIFHESTRNFIEIGSLCNNITRRFWSVDAFSLCLSHQEIQYKAYGHHTVVQDDRTRMHASTAHRLPPSTDFNNLVKIRILNGRQEVLDGQQRATKPQHQHPAQLTAL